MANFISIHGLNWKVWRNINLKKLYCYEQQLCYSLFVQFSGKNKQLLDEHRGERTFWFENLYMNWQRIEIVKKKINCQIFAVIPPKRRSSKLTKSNEPNYLQLPLTKTGLMDLLYLDKKEINDTFFIVQWRSLKQDANSIGIVECLIMAWM